MRLADFVLPTAPSFPMLPAVLPLTDNHARRSISINAAGTHASRCSAHALLNQRYSWRGYEEVSMPHADSVSHFPLTATQDGQIIGTLTVGLDGSSGLNCDRAFEAEVQLLRDQGARLCEFTKLAVDASFGGKHVLAALFHVAYLAADRLGKVDTLLMEVNPRHVRYYMRMLGARVIGDVRANTQVNAPAVLLSMAFRDVRGKIDDIAGSPHCVGGERSLYSLAFTRQEEDAIIDRLTRRGPSGDDVTPFGFRLPKAQMAAGGEH